MTKQENVQKQLAEIELISSIYSNTNEFIIEDPIAVSEAESFLVNNEFPKRSLGYIIKFSVSIKESNDIQTEDGSDHEMHYVQVSKSN